MEEKDFKEKMTPEQYRVMREKGTETPFSGKYWDTEEDGIYMCAACGNELFSSEQKFDAGSGWPSFKKPISEKNLEFKKEPTPAGEIEIRCKKCKSHLGYVIQEEKRNYYRINSVALDFHKDAELELELPEQEEKKKDEGKKDEPRAEAQSSATSAISTPSYAFVIASTISGMIVGAGGGFYLCHTLSAPAATNVATTTPATTTEEVIEEEEPVVVPPRPTPTPTGTATTSSAVPASSTGSAASADSIATSTGAR